MITLLLLFLEQAVYIKLGSGCMQVQTQLANHVAAVGPAILVGLACGVLGTAFTVLNVKVIRLRDTIIQVWLKIISCLFQDTFSAVSWDVRPFTAGSLGPVVICFQALHMHCSCLQFMQLSGAWGALCLLMNHCKCTIGA